MPTSQNKTLKKANLAYLPALRRFQGMEKEMAVVED
jgi:hypothetical protein